MLGLLRQLPLKKGHLGGKLRRSIPLANGVEFIFLERAMLLLGEDGVEGNLFFLERSTQGRYVVDEHSRALERTPRCARVNR